MAITTLDGLIAAPKIIIPHYRTTTRTTVATGWFTMQGVAGVPGAGVLAGGETTPPANTAGRVCTDATVGGGYPTIPFTANRTYLSRLLIHQTVSGMVALYDRLWCGGTYAFNANVAVTSGSWSSRVSYSGGSADYNGLEIWAEMVTAATGNQTVNVSYTDQGGAAGSTGAIGIGAAPSIGRCWQLPLATDDTGVQSITNVTGGTATVGTFNVMVLRPLFKAYIDGAGRGNLFNWSDLALTEIFNDSALYTLYMSPSGTSSGVPLLDIQLANG